MNTMRKICEVLENVCGCPFEKESDLLGLDSLGFINLFLQLEEAFSITWQESDMDPSAVQCVGDVLALVRRYTGETL